MQSTRLALLGVAAVLVTAAAAWLANERQPARDSSADRPVLPELSGHGDALTSIRIVGPGNATAVTLQRKGQAWVVAERNGYPVDAERLRRFVQGLADLEIRDTKTSDPALYARLGVEDVAAASAQGVRVDLIGLGADVGLIVGKAATGNGSYVRRHGVAQSLEAAPSLAVERDPKWWVDRHLLQIDPARIRSIEVAPAGGRAYSLTRADAKQPDFELRGAPAGRKQASQSPAAAQSQALAPLDCDDVRPAAEVDFGAKPAGRVVYTTFDGLQITLDGARVGDQGWLKLQAMLAAGATGDEPQREADALQRRTSGWACEIPAYRLDSLLRPIDGLLAP